jgi:cyclic pyranopterin phosphate synthase
MKTCLYGNNDLNLRALLRSGASPDELAAAIAGAVNHKAKDGHEAEAMRSPVEESMATIGG